MTPDGEQWLRGVNVSVQFSLPAPIPQVQLIQAEVFAAHLATVHVGNWSYVLPTPLHFDTSAATSCTDTPCTTPTQTVQYVLHFVLRLPPSFPPGYHLFWLTVPGENGQVLSSKVFAYATPLPKPKTVFKLSGDLLTIKVSSEAFRLATPKLPVVVHASAQLQAGGAMRGRVAAATAGDSVTLRHPVKTATLTVRLRPAGQWFLDWGVSALYATDGRFYPLDGPERIFRIHG